jgi:hypothetical protein
MIKLTEEQIKEIADNLDSGFKCFYNKKTKGILSFPNTENWIGIDENPWKKEQKKLEKNWDDYVEFESYTTKEALRVMADFANSIDNEQLRKKLIFTLNGYKPFRNFKWEIDDSGEYRQQWFDFKRARYIQAVKDQIERLNNFEENV